MKTRNDLPFDTSCESEKKKSDDKHDEKTKVIQKTTVVQSVSSICGLQMKLIYQIEIIIDYDVWLYFLHASLFHSRNLESVFQLKLDALMGII